MLSPKSHFSVRLRKIIVWAREYNLVRLAFPQSGSIDWIMDFMPAKVTFDQKPKKRAK